MSRVFTYSFEDTAATISHPNFGQYSAYGTGLGDITVSMANDVTSHDRSADLSVVISKHVYKDGTITFNVLQSSDFHNWLKKFTSFIENSPSDRFASGSIVIKNTSTGDSFTCRGVSHQKKPDVKYTAQAGTIDWVFMAAEIIYSNI